jgi:metal-responsive CopG/Arc/MetJ family transcriptional regulator
MGHDIGMKVKTSITLSEHILKAIDRVRDKSQSRSFFIEQAVRYYLLDNAKRERDNKDFEILNENSEQLNLEAEDVLSYQADW